MTINSKAGGAGAAKRYYVRLAEFLPLDAAKTAPGIVHPPKAKNEEGGVNVMTCHVSHQKSIPAGAGPSLCREEERQAISHFAQDRQKKMAPREMKESLLLINSGCSLLPMPLKLSRVLVE